MNEMERTRWEKKGAKGNLDSDELIFIALTHSRKRSIELPDERD